ncbi:hypothetical protein UY3_16255 [Chelonia mydas]|uniref:Uncharacterized protein n=1 Tax=Chelonia mydas TaxID=8469 RepID=M7AUK0_CHEMY|nr:hypothetical protein UY3_16255 [Chelonia mydas]
MTLSARTGRNPRLLLRDIFCGLSHLCPAIGYTSDLSACPHANASDSSTIIDSSTVLGTALGSVLAPVFHAGTAVYIDIDFVGACEWIGTGFFDGSFHRTDCSADTWSGICSSSTI